MTTPTEPLPEYRVIPVTNPAAGADLVMQVSGAGDWLVMSIVLTLVTSAAVANRHVVLSADDGTTTWWRGAAAAVQAASLTVRYSAFPGASPGALVGAQNPILFPDHGLYLPQGSLLRTSIAAIDAADTIVSAALRVIELPAGPDYKALPMPSWDPMPLR